MNSKNDFSKLIRAGIDTRRLAAKRISMRNDPTTPGRSAKRTKTYDGVEWRGIANAVSFERDRRGVTLKTPGTRAAALLAS